MADIHSLTTTFVVVLNRPGGLYGVIQSDTSRHTSFMDGSSNARKSAQSDEVHGDCFVDPEKYKEGIEELSRSQEVARREASEEEDEFDRENGPDIPRPVYIDNCTCVVLKATGVDIREWVIDKAWRGEAPFMNEDDLQFLLEETDKYLVENKIKDSNGKQERYTLRKLRQKFDNNRNRLREFYDDGRNQLFEATGYRMPKDHAFYKDKKFWGYLPSESERSHHFFFNKRHANPANAGAAGSGPS
jgi:hypothetical protein